MSNENFISEINEELRSDRLRNFWKRFGPYVITLMVLIVVATAGYEGYNWWRSDASAKASDDFYAALQLADGTDAAAAEKALDGLVAGGWGAYPTLAKFREAALLARDGKTDEAVAAYDGLASAQTNQRLRDVAMVLAAYLLVDKGDVAAVNQRVAGIADGSSPMRNAAREALGLVKYKAGDLEGARQSFQAAVDDANSSSEMRQRIAVYLRQLLAQGIAAPAAADTAPAADAAAPASTSSTDAATPAAGTETSVGDAPAMDVPAPAAEGTTPPAN
jgi:hypothetical protein